MSDDVDECLAWVQKAEEVFSSDLTSITDEDKMIEAFGKHEQVYEEMMSQRGRIEAVLKRGNSMLEMVPSDGKSEMKEKLDVLFKKWSNLSERASFKETSFDDFISDQESFYEDLEGFVEWMQNLGLLVSQDIDEDLTEATQKGKLLAHRELCKDIAEHEKMFQKLFKSGNRILDGLPFERKDSFGEQLQRLIEGWQNLVDGAVDKEEELAELSGTDDGFSVLLRTKSMGEGREMRRVSIERIQDDVTEIDGRLVLVKESLKATQRYSTIEEQFQQHLEICLKSDEEMENIEKLVAKASKLPEGTEERKRINEKIEKLNKDWELLANVLHRERSDLEKAMEVNRNIEVMVQEFEMIDTSLLVLEGEESAEHSIDELEVGLDNILSFIDKNSFLQGKVMNLPDKVSMEVKRGLLKKVDNVFQKAALMKNEIKEHIDGLVEKDSIKAEIDGLLLRASMFNEPQFDESEDDDDDERDDEDRVAAISEAVNDCKIMIETAKALKAKLIERPDRKSLSAYENCLDEVLRNLEGERNKLDEKLESWQESKELKEQFLKDWNKEDVSSKLDIVMQRLSNKSSPENIEDILHDTRQIEQNLQEFRLRTAVIVKKIPNQGLSSLEIVNTDIDRLQKRVTDFLNINRNVSLINEKSKLLQDELCGIENDIMVSNEFLELKEKRIIFGNIQEEMKRKAEQLEIYVEETISKRLEIAPSDFDRILQAVATSALETAKSVSIKLDQMKDALGKEEKIQALKEKCDSLINAPLDSLLQESNDVVEGLHGAVLKIEELRSNCNKIKSGLDISECCFGVEYSKKLESDIENVESALKSFEEIVSEKESQARRASETRNDIKRVISNCEMLVDRPLKSVTSEEELLLILKEKESEIDGMIALLDDSVPKAETMTAISTKDADLLITNMQKVKAGLLESKQRMKTLRENADNFNKLSNAVRDDLSNEIVCRLATFNSLNHVQDYLIENKTKLAGVSRQIGEMRNAFGIIQSSVSEDERERIEKNIMDLENSYAVKRNDLQSIEEELVRSMEDTKECGNEFEGILNSLDLIYDGLEADCSNVKDEDAMTSSLDKFLKAIDQEERQLNQLTNKQANMVSCFPLTEQNLINAKVGEAKNKIWLARQQHEEKAKRHNDRIEQKNELDNCLQVIVEWTGKIDEIISEVITLDVLERESKALEEIEQEMADKEREINQICEIIAKPSMIFFCIFHLIDYIIY